MSDFPDFNHDGKVDGLDYALWDEMAGGGHSSSSGGDSPPNGGCGTWLWILVAICAISLIFKLFS